MMRKHGGRCVHVVETILKASVAEEPDVHVLPIRLLAVDAALKMMDFLKARLSYLESPEGKTRKHGKMIWKACR